jgi:cation-transporting ATPase 13A1
VEKTGKGAAATGSSAKRIDIVKRFPFDSTLRRMSCIIRVGGRGLKVVAKGSPESIARVCERVPAHMQSMADGYAAKGLRVIALAARSLDDSTAVNDVHRETAETGLAFVGFAIFECPLKTDAAETIQLLQGGLHRCVMITGDSIPTAAAVAGAVGMADVASAYVACEDKETLMWRRYETNSSEDETAPSAAAVAEPPAQGSWLFVNAEALSADVMDAAINKYAQRVAVWARCAPHQKEAIVASMKAHGSNVLMAGDGTNDVGGLKQAHVGIAVLNSALVLASVEAAEKEKNKPLDQRPKPTQITATPGEFVNPMPAPLRAGAGMMESVKHQFAVARHQAEVMHKAKLEAAQRNSKQSQAVSAASVLTKAKEAHGVESIDAASAMSSMFNDMGDDGNMPMIKLGDASIAAPFTCKSKKLTSICDIVRLGRCTLVTTLQMYKILALNCLVNAYTIAVLFTDGVKFGQAQMIVSGLVIAVCFLFLSRSKPLDKLAPQRPINRVFHPYTLTSIGLQFAVHLYSLAATLALVQEEDPDALTAQRGEEEEDFRPTLLNSILFLMTTMMSVTTFAVNYKGHPFMTSLKENRPMAIALAVLTFIVVACALELDAEMNEYLQIVKFPTEELRNKFFVLLVIDVVGAYASEFVARVLLGALP